ncbi:MAG: putative lipopolysaccharide heptosyltransferase III, partial [Betaproteobacteria bacterium]
PVLSVLKRALPDGEIDTLVYDDTAAMLSGHPDLSQLLTINRRPAGKLAAVRAEWQLFRRLRARRYDLLVCLSHKPRVAWLARFTGARYAVTVDRPDRPKFWRRSFTHFYPNPKGNSRHAVELNLDALRRIGIAPAAEEKQLVMIAGDGAERRIAAVLAENGLTDRGYIHVHPGSRWLFKCWPASRVATMINALQRRGEVVVLTAGPEPAEMAWVGEVTARLDAPVVDLTGKLSLKELAALVARAKLFIGMDSVPMHMASAMRTPTVAMFGPSGEIEWGPWRTVHRIVTSAHSCRPCGINGCGGSNRSECLETIEVSQVLAAVDSVLESARAA